MYWEITQDLALKDLLLDTNLSLFDIAEEIDVDIKEVRQRIKALGLTWVGRKKGHASRGQYALYLILKKLMPGEKIVTEEPIGERLRLDVYCPRYKLGVEYHGRQHFEYVEYFHGTKEGFQESLRRDERKIEICRDLGISLVVFRYCDKLDEETVYQRIIETLNNDTQIKDAPKQQKKELSAVYQAYLARQREYNRERYRRMKARQSGEKPA